MTNAVHRCEAKDYYTSIDGTVKVRVCRSCRGVDLKRGDGDWQIMTTDQWDLPHASDPVQSSSQSPKG